MERNWHPDALKFDLLEDSEKEMLKKSLEKTKGNRDNPIEYRLIKGKRQYLDGRNRALCCDELAIKPNERAVKVKDAELRDYFIRKNVARRHLLAKTRQEWVADLRADGQSTRQIADTIGVSHTTVERDLESTGTNVPVNTPGGKITGKDGRKQPALKPKSGPTTRTPSKSKNGQVAFNYKTEFDTHIGAIAKLLDKMGHELKKNDTRPFTTLRQCMSGFVTNMKMAYQLLDAHRKESFK